MDLTILLGVIVGVVHLAGYWFYHKAQRKSGIKPDQSSWLMWAGGSILNLISYSKMSGDWVKDILPAVCAFACIILFAEQCYLFGFKKIPLKDIPSFLCDLGATMVWYIAGSPLVGNIAYQIATVATFVPIIRETRREPMCEDRLPWMTWSIAYGLDVVLVITRWNQWGDVVYPLVCLVLHILMAVSAKKKQ